MRDGSGNGCRPSSNGRWLQQRQEARRKEACWKMSDSILGQLLREAMPRIDSINWSEVSGSGRTAHTCLIPAINKNAVRSENTTASS